MINFAIVSTGLTQCLTVNKNFFARQHVDDGGKVRGNLMICVQATNDKLRDRLNRINSMLDRE